MTLKPVQVMPSSGNQQRILAKRMGQIFLGKTTDALALDAVDQNQDEHRNRQGKGGAHVGRGHNAHVIKAEDLVSNDGEQIYRNQVHDVPQEHPDEDGERHRRDEPSIAVEAALDRVINETNQHLDERLQLAGHAAGGTHRDNAEHGEHQQPQHSREEQRVEVPGVKTDETVLAARLEVLKVVRDIPCSGVISCHNVNSQVSSKAAPACKS